MSVVRSRFVEEEPKETHSFFKKAVGPLKTKNPFLGLKSNIFVASNISSSDSEVGVEDLNLAKGNSDIEPIPEKVEEEEKCICKFSIIMI